jgi:DNA-binding LacI/PurR family transcriptional regulator
VTGRSQLLGVVAQNTTLFGPASLLTAFERVAAEAGFAVSVAGVRRLDRASLSAAIERHLDQRVAGIVVIATVRSANAALRAVPEDVPLVAIDGDMRENVSVVTVDQVAGARLATRHLLDAGHRTVGHISGPSDWIDSVGRLRGWRAELRAAGAPIPEPIRGDWSAASGYAAGQQIARSADVTAVFAANDHMALGLYRALREAGRAVPDDVSVVGFDDVPEAGYYLPPLTTIRPDFTAVAHRTLATLQERIRSVDSAPVRAVVAPELVVRDSVTTITEEM